MTLVFLVIIKTPTRDPMVEERSDTAHGSYVIGEVINFIHNQFFVFWTSAVTAHYIIYIILILIFPRRL